MNSHAVDFPSPPLARALFDMSRWSWVWVIVRLYLGYEWIEAAAEKMGNPAWMQTGLAVKGFWEKALGDTPRGPIIAYEWYHHFIRVLYEGGHHVWFAKLIVYAELIVGIALLIGIFTGIAALAGAFLNWNFMMAGTASANPVLFLLSILVILAWKTAGYWGLDRWLLPAMGTPWAPPKLVLRERPA